MPDGLRFQRADVWPWLLCVVQEHAGNDPHAQLVPAYLGGWNKEAAYTAPPVVGPTASALLADPKHALSSGAFVCAHAVLNSRTLTAGAYSWRYADSEALSARRYRPAPGGNGERLLRGTPPSPAAASALIRREGEVPESDLTVLP